MYDNSFNVAKQTKAGAPTYKYTIHENIFIVYFLWRWDGGGGARNSANQGFNNYFFWLLYLKAAFIYPPLVRDRVSRFLVHFSVHLSLLLFFVSCSLLYMFPCICLILLFLHAYYFCMFSFGPPSLTSFCSVSPAPSLCIYLGSSIHVLFLLIFHWPSLFDILLIRCSCPMYLVLQVMSCLR